MQSKRLPFTAVIGITNRAETEYLYRFACDDQLIMAGVRADHETLVRGSAYRPGYPLVGSIANLFVKNERAINAICFSSDVPHEDEQYMALLDLDEIGGAQCDCLQLDAAWIFDRPLERFRERCPQKTIVLRAQASALSKANPEAAALAQRIKRLFKDRLFDYALLDACGPIDVLAAAQCFERLQGIEGLAIAAAGNLNSIEVPRLLPLRDRFGPFGLQAEEKLIGDQGLNLASAELFLSSARAFSGESRREAA